MRTTGDIVLHFAWFAAASMAAGCGDYVGPEGERLLVSAQQASERGEDSSVVRDTSTFLAEYPKTAYSAKAHYLRGMSHYRLKELPAAKEDLVRAAGRARAKDVRVGTLKALGDIARDEGDMDAAITRYGETLAELGPSEKPADEVRYSLGCALQNRGQWAEADKQFDRVVHVFAGTERARLAEVRMRCTAWTVQAGAYERKGDAESEARRLAKEGLAARVAPVQTKGRLEFRVNVGAFETRDGANSTLRAVSEVKKDAFVTVTR